MADFDYFVKGLGSHAKHYAPEQLKQLHADVRALAHVLVAVRGTKAARRQKICPHPPIDDIPDDRTIEVTNTVR
jgi:hypothetical protein